MCFCGIVYKIATPKGMVEAWDIARIFGVDGLHGAWRNLYPFASFWWGVFSKGMKACKTKIYGLQPNMNYGNKIYQICRLSCLVLVLSCTTKRLTNGLRRNSDESRGQLGCNRHLRRQQSEERSHTPFSLGAMHQNNLKAPPNCSSPRFYHPLNMNAPESTNKFVPKQELAPTPQLYDELVDDT